MEDQSRAETGVFELGNFIKEYRPGKSTLIRYLIGAILLIVVGLVGSLWLAATFLIEGFNPRGKLHAEESPVFFFLVGILCAAAIVGAAYLIYKMLRVRQFRAQQYQRGFVFTLFRSEEVVGFWDIAQVEEWKSGGDGMAAVGSMSPFILIVAMLTGETGGEWCRYRISCRDGRVFEVNTALAVKANSIGVILKNFRDEFGYRWIRRSG